MRLTKQIAQNADNASTDAPAFTAPPSMPSNWDEIALIEKAIAEVKAEIAEIHSEAAEARQQADAVRREINLLGGEPEPADFETADEWQAAKSQWTFTLAKLRPKLEALDQQQLVFVEKAKMPADRLSALEVNRQRLVVEGRIANLQAASAAMIDAIRIYNSELRKLSGNDCNGLYLTDRQDILRSFQAQHFGTFERVTLTMIAPVN